ncbi:unnamed protein product [Vitrella brassicaformis CCMP3155]|uniref:Uncharacterized protein n=2 Tax=Vitrella brassicaformis TaxID=1169539 RepID=A0A0G4EWY5_VITBC|nr:unnamed protein product [Vitrella brassicaformis CCMP3155]|mmetsp:Transcript_54110/g.136178  ORF Transcript_54110/g.136178 Transcript_54110/m.136178 type:complete len:114 (+) Transcript_54110:220-561(+)|eukprot:CEM02594.1 unnamed protein product [Vitrella brassicaformis CCMP3155]
MRVSVLVALGLLPLLFGPLPSWCSELVLKRDMHDECRADDPSCPHSFRQCTTVERLQAAMVGFLGITAVGLGIAMAPFSAGGSVVLGAEAGGALAAGGMVGSVLAGRCTVRSK